MWKDIDIKFTKKVDGDLNDMTGVYAINNSLTNIFKTIPLSRRMLPTFASGLYDLLFEQIDNITAQSIGRILLANIEDWEPRISIDNVNVYPNEDNNRYDVTMTYHIVNDGTDTEGIYTFTTIIEAA